MQTGGCRPLTPAGDIRWAGWTGDCVKYAKEPPLQSLSPFWGRRSGGG